MVSTRTRSAAAEARKKPALHDITNDGKGGAKRKAEGRAQPEGGLFDGRPRGREKSDDYLHVMQKSKCATFVKI